MYSSLLSYLCKFVFSTVGQCPQTLIFGQCPVDTVHLLCYMGNFMFSTIRPNWFKVIASDCTIALLSNFAIVWFPVCHAKEKAALINIDISELYRLSTRCHCQHINLTLLSATLLGLYQLKTFGLQYNLFGLD